MTWPFSRMPSCFPQRPVHDGGTHRQQARHNCGRQPKMAVVIPAETRIGTNGRRRMPEIRSYASHTTVSGSQVA